MELLCCENQVDTVIRSYPDQNLLNDDRVLQNFLHTEERYMISYSYFKSIQTEIKPHMREIVGKWMLEVCEEQQFCDKVFQLAINYMDRFLSLVRISKTQLQLLGSVCLLLASKLRETNALTAEKLCIYTDRSVSALEITQWELFVLLKLKWDLCTITPHDFLDLLLHRMQHFISCERIRRHAETFVTLCALDFKFSMHPPSMVACACIAAAYQGLRSCNPTWPALPQLLDGLHRLTGIEADCLRACIEQVEEMVSSTYATAQQSYSDQSRQQPETKHVTEEHTGLETPTDVRDIEF